MKRFLFIATVICSVSSQIQCSLQEKIAQSADKIAVLREDIKSGKDQNNTSKCGGSKCCGNSCGRCGKCHN